jgi:hypothetical protein
LARNLVLDRELVGDTLTAAGGPDGRMLNQSVSIFCCGQQGTNKTFWRIKY